MAKITDLNKQSKGKTQDFTEKPPKTNYMAKVKSQTMKEGMNIEVNGCCECPMRNLYNDGWGGSECNHPHANEYDTSNVKKGEAPKWCPLKKQSITITLKENSDELRN